MQIYHLNYAQYVDRDTKPVDRKGSVGRSHGIKKKKKKKVLELTHRGKVPQHEEMCYLLDCIIRLQTYLCESAFSHMKIIKSKYSSTLTDDHLEVA